LRDRKGGSGVSISGSSKRFSFSPEFPDGVGLDGDNFNSFMELIFHVGHMVEGRGVHRVLVGKPEGKRPLGRPRRRWEDNIKMDFQEVGGGCGDWVELAQDRDRWRALVSTVMNLRVQKKREFLD